MSKPEEKPVMIKVVAQPGMRVKDPNTFAVLEEGKEYEVVSESYWYRRFADGEVSINGDVHPSFKAKAKPEPEEEVMPAKEETHLGVLNAPSVDGKNKQAAKKGS